MARLWSNVEHRRAHRHDVVDLARVNYAHKRIAHHHNVQVRCRKRSGKPVQRLIRQDLYIVEFVTRSEVVHLLLLAATSNKTKHNVFMLLQLKCGFEQRVERMTRTVIARIHHDKPIY